MNSIEEVNQLLKIKYNSVGQLMPSSSSFTLTTIASQVFKSIELKNHEVLASRSFSDSDTKRFIIDNSEVKIFADCEELIYNNELVQSIANMDEEVLASARMIFEMPEDSKVSGVTYRYSPNQQQISILYEAWTHSPLGGDIRNHFDTSIVFDMFAKVVCIDSSDNAEHSAEVKVRTLPTEYFIFNDDTMPLLQELHRYLTYEFFKETRDATNTKFKILSRFVDDALRYKV